MYPPLSFAPLKAMLLAIAEHITVVELGVFMLLFLVFVFFFFLSLVFWHFRRILFVFFLIETAILLCIPYGISQISQKIIYPIEVRYDKFRPFVYTTGFNYDIEITSKAKLPIKECLLTVIPKRAGANIIKKPKTSVESSEIESSQTESSIESNVESNTKSNEKSSTKTSVQSNIAMDSNQQDKAESSQVNTTQDMADSSTKQDSTKPTQESLNQSKIAQNTQISQTGQENNDDSKEPQTQESKESTNAEIQSQESNKSQENKKPKKIKTPKPPSPYALKAYKILDYLVPIDAFVEVLELETPLTYNKKVRWQGIIRDYKYDENYGAQISCH